METIRKTLGARIRECRKRRQETAEELAEGLGVHVNTVYVLERGEQWISSELLEKIAHFFRVPVSALFADSSVRIEPTPAEALEVLQKALSGPRLIQSESPLVGEIVALTAALDESELRALIKVLRSRDFLQKKEDDAG